MSSVIKSTIHCFLSSEAEYKVLHRASQILGQHLSRLSAKEFDNYFSKWGVVMSSKLGLTPNGMS